MTNGRTWTVMIVPNGCEASRTVTVSERGLRRAGIAAVVVAFVSVVGAGVLGAFAAGGRPHQALAAAARSDADRALELAALGRRVNALRDTLAELAKRDDRIRVVAGLQPHDSLSASLAAEADGRTLSLDSAGGSVAATAAADVDVDKLIYAANTLSASFAQVSDTLAKSTARLSSLPSIMPTAGWLTSHFSRRRFHPVLNYARAHEGIDVAAPTGTPIVAPAAGVVTQASTERGYGLVVEVDHGNGIVTKFAHCSKAMVRRGQRVTRGQEIAAVGSSGLSTGPHLHYEIRVNGKVVDPLTYVLPAGVVTD